MRDMKNYCRLYIFAKGKRILLNWCVKYTMVYAIKNSFLYNQNTIANFKSIYTIHRLRYSSASEIVGMLCGSQHQNRNTARNLPMLSIFVSREIKIKNNFSQSCHYFVNISQVQKLKTPKHLTFF